MRIVRRSDERRRGAAPLGAHPERRVLTPARRAALRGEGAHPRTNAVVLPPVVNMFERPDDASPVVSQAILGTTVTILEHRRRFSLVETPDRYHGWMGSQALGHIVAGRGAYPGGERVVEVVSLLANIYREPDVTTSSPMAMAPMLARLEMMGEGQDWIRIRLPDGREGWLQKGDARHVSPDGPASSGAAAGRAVAAARERRRTAPRTRPGGKMLPDPQAVAATALRFLGLPYLWGGTTTFGLDCSGLAQLAYRAHGFLLPRDADLQYTDPRLESVPRGSIRAGDLVFFGPGARSITHVGIALGSDTFANATTYRSPTVRIDRLSDPYWKKLYRGARRIEE